MKCKDCPYACECDDALDYGYCPNFEPVEDIGSATVREMRLQNNEL